MTEINQKESPQVDIKNGEMEPQRAPGFGALLKDEREKKGLSHEQVSQITRLRRHILEALENEDWRNLPPSVFVKGFIRSYAKALGLDEKKFLDLYERNAPLETESPTPIIEPRKSKRGLFFILVLLLGVIGITLYLWNEAPSPENAPSQLKTEKTPSHMELEKAPSQVEPEKPPLPLESKKAATLIKKESPPEIQVTPGEKEQLSASGTEEPTVGLEKVDKPALLPTQEQPVKPPVDEDLVVASTTEPPSVTDWLVLKGTVNARTWIRLHIDDQEPKEYIFQPGARPQWKAREGFYILIGNAAGIEFEFKGKKIENLGTLGQVVSLKIPENFEITIAEE